MTEKSQNSEDSSDNNEGSNICDVSESTSSNGSSFSSGIVTLTKNEKTKSQFVNWMYISIMKKKQIQYFITIFITLNQIESCADCEC